MALLYADYSRHVLSLVEASLEAVEPTQGILNALSRTDDTLTVGGDTYDLGKGRTYIISAGKAARPMAQAAAGTLGDALSKGVVVSKKGEGDSASPLPETLISFEAGHPLSDARSVEAAAAVQQLLAGTTADDLVLFLISGGASALLTQPLISLTDWQRLNEALLGSGCTIDEFNAVRRQLDRVKGGGLARWAQPAMCCSLILSDVVGNPLPAIGSGPTVDSEETAQDALSILHRYMIEARLDADVWAKIKKALSAQPQPQPIDQTRNRHHIIGDVRQAAMAALRRAIQLGFVSQLLTVHLEGEAREVGRVVAAIAKDTPPGRCVILGGETTVTLRGDGQGGRNQELALAAAIAGSGLERTVIASFATDGEDGTTDAAGAVVTGQTLGLALKVALAPYHFMDNNDSYTFFNQLDHRLAGQRDAAEEAEPPRTLIRIGSSGTNVNDLIFILTYGSHEH